jgi:hypothetical protein
MRQGEMQRVATLLGRNSEQKRQPKKEHHVKRLLINEIK